jgi:hypothetical protein
MPRPPIDIPMRKDLLSLQTLLEAGLNNPQIRKYYEAHGILMSERTLVSKIKELRDNDY